MTRVNLLCLCWIAIALPLAGCTRPREFVHNGFKVGPNYVEPPAPVAETFIDAPDKRVRQSTEDLSQWWNAFTVPDPNDPKAQIPDPDLHNLIVQAANQNLTLRQAGMRILQARAVLGISVGNFFPQSQFFNASEQSIAQSIATGGVSNNVRQHYLNQWATGFSVAWEVDFWGRFRRAIEASEASLEASVHDYDEILITLLGDVASNYVAMRTTQKRIEYARENLKLQGVTVALLEQRKKVGVDDELNVNQAKSIYYQTAAAIPELEINLRTATNRLCILLGVTMEDLIPKLNNNPIPNTPTDVAVGIPADLIRRRPEVRRAERQAAAQSALIGVAEAEFYPHISIAGNIGFQSQDPTFLFTPAALAGSIGPSVQWNVLNYGRLLSNVRLQDARFRELMFNYQNIVLSAQQDVENGLVTFLKAQERFQTQSKSVEYGQAAEKVVLERYRVGTANIAQVILVQQNLVLQKDTLAIAQGEIALGLVQVYRSLGGGWEIRQNLLPPPETSRHRHHLGARFGRPE